MANGFYWRERHEIEMWTAWNDAIERPQIWDMLHQHDESLTSAAWFGLLTKGAGADLICTPAPIHNPDGSESLWCYTRPTELYGTLRDALDHFPLKHFWGPLAGIQSTAWIVRQRDSGGPEVAAQFLLYLPAPFGLRRPEIRARQSGGRAGAGRLSMVSGATFCGLRRSLRRGSAAVDRSQRIHDRAGRSRGLSQPRAPLGRMA